MTQYLRAYAERADDAAKLGDPMRFVASTANVARDGLVIPADAWQLENFRKNPVFLWSHDYFSRPPIGKVTNVSVEDDRLIADVQFDGEDEFAVAIERKYRSGVLSAVSVGWDTLSMEPPNGPNTVPRITRADLLDVSAVPVPSDPDALKVRQQRGLATMAHDILKVVEPDDTPNSNSDPLNPNPETPPAARMSWEEASGQMVRLLRPYVQRPEDERRAEYRRLQREYERHKKTPPEYLPQDAIDALTADEIRGLFVEGEPETHADAFAAMASRAGKVLSARTQADVERIIEIAQGILARAVKESKDDQQADDDERAAAAMLARLDEKFGAAA